MKILLNTFVILTLSMASTIINAADKISPETVAGATTVDAAAAKKLFDAEVIFIDVRKDKDWSAGRIPGAEQIELKKKFSEKALSEFVKKDQDVVIYCNGPKCMRSSKASALAVAWGFKKVHYFRAGFPAWQIANYPVE